MKAPITPERGEITDEMIERIRENRAKRKEISAQLLKEYEHENALWIDLMEQIITLAKIITGGKQK